MKYKGILALCKGELEDMEWNVFLDEDGKNTTMLKEVVANIKSGMPVSGEGLAAINKLIEAEESDEITLNEDWVQQLRNEYSKLEEVSGGGGMSIPETTEETAEGTAEGTTEEETEGEPEEFGAEPAEIDMPKKVKRSKKVDTSIGRMIW